MRTRTRSLLGVATAALIGLTAALLGATTASASGCSTYYVSSVGGSDSNDGCSTSTPWQTLANVNATTFAAGNQILFAKGGAWSGALTPQGSGSSGNPIVVSSYGTGAMPIIAGGGAAAAVKLYDQHDWTIQNLEITNTAATASPRAGIYVHNDTTGILHGIHLVGNNIHDIKGYWKDGDPQPTTTSAISFDLSDSNTTSGWDDILIDGNTLTKTDAGAIYLGSPVGLNHNIATTNVIIQNNTISDAGGNAIVCVFCASPLVQYNVTTDSGYRYSGAALWSGWTTNGVWQYNEVARNFRNFVDGQAFDIDNNDSGTILQYNYTHDNPSGFMEFCCSASFGVSGNSTIRYNISQNDGANFANFGTLSGLTSGSTAQIYNNTIYMPEGDNGAITAGTPNSGASATFTNNLIYKLGTGGYTTTNTTWSHNLMFGNHPGSEPADAAKITADPALLAPGGGGDGRSTATAYQLRSGSPALGAGALISGNGGTDFFGNAVSSSSAPNVGAYNGTGVAAPAATPGAFWRFDEGSGTVASDSSGNNNPGALQAGASWTSGKMGPSAVALTGASNSYVDVPTTAIDSSSSYTVEAWVKPNSLTGNQTYASIDGGSISPFYLQLSAGKFTLTERSADSTSSSFTQVVGSAPTTGTWYDLIGVYDASAHTIKLYVNGVLQGTAAYSSAWKATGHTTIGRAKWNGSPVDFANASIDDVRMLPRAVTDREAFAIGTGATAYVAADEGSGRRFADTTGDFGAGSLASNAGWTTGKIGASALSFDGSLGTLAQIPDTVINTGGSFSVSSWVKLNTLTGNQTFASMWGGAISPFYLQLTGGRFAFVLRDSDSTGSTASTATSTTTPVTGTWYHLVGSYDATAGTASIYVNGSLESSVSSIVPFTVTGAAVLGAAEWNRVPVDMTSGAIDDVHYYNRTLSAAEVATLAAP